MEDQPSLASRQRRRDCTSPTHAGVVLGTVGYMAPNSCADFLSISVRTSSPFRAILYELLSGRHAFARDTAPETMTAILNDEPANLTPGVPTGLARIVSRCLEKDPAHRFRPRAISRSRSRMRRTLPAWRRRRPRRVRGLLRLAGGSGPGAGARSRADAHRVLALAGAPGVASPAPLPDSLTVEFGGPGNFSLSPDGRHLAFVGLGPDGVHRNLGPRHGFARREDAARLRSECVTPPPVWSPDGRFLAYSAGERLKKLNVCGGASRKSCAIYRALPWAAPGIAVATSSSAASPSGLFRVRETGGALIPVTELDGSRKEEVHVMPTFLPDGRHFVSMRISPSVPAAERHLRRHARRQARLAEPSDADAVRSGRNVHPGDGGTGRLLFVRQGTLMARPFDAERLAVAGDPVPVAQRVGSFRDSRSFGVSHNGVLVYRIEDDTQVSWIDREGRVTGRASDAGPYRMAALSPDGTRAVASRITPDDATKADLWLFDLARAGGGKRLAARRGLAEMPTWSRDGSHVSYMFDHSTMRDLPVNGVDTDAELLRTNSQSGLWPGDW